ncbi:MAG: Imm27 family immunity protein [Elusimicrobia bacterium]|nr:Imm27 family immunity protein [Elusimicrobiota bacterium]
MKKLQPHETELIGAWVKGPDGIVGDAACQRIEWLVSEVLELIGVEKDSGGWETLYRDPADGRCWLKSYPQGEFHGGGAPSLKNIALTAEDLSARFVSPEKWKAETEKFMRERNIRFILPDEPKR